MKRTFFDQWHRITGLRVGLRPGVIARLHHYRDEPWYVLHQQSHAGYFRVAPAGYAFIQRLSPERTIDDHVWPLAPVDGNRSSQTSLPVASSKHWPKPSVELW